MTQMCPSCGRASEFENGVCFGCGARLDARSRRPDNPRHRAGGPLRRHSRLLLAVAGVAAAIVVVAIVSSSPDEAPSSGAVATTPAGAGVDTETSASDSDSDADLDDLVTATGADGKTYRCSSSVIDRIDAARGVVTSREAVVKQRRAALRRIERRYPDGRAPSAVVRRYGRLVKRANAQVRATNRAIDEYNGLLVSLCEE
jgi:hypothetical protein